MQDYQLRVIEERDDLLEKIKKLTTFLMSDASRHVNAEEKDRMWRQLYTMLSYGNILSERIDSFIK